MYAVADYLLGLSLMTIGLLKEAAVSEFRFNSEKIVFILYLNN